MIDLLSQSPRVRVGVKNRVNVSVVAGVCRHSAPVGKAVDLVAGHYAQDAAREPLWVYLKPREFVS